MTQYVTSDAYKRRPFSLYCFNVSLGQFHIISCSDLERAMQLALTGRKVRLGPSRPGGHDMLRLDDVVMKSDPAPGRRPMTSIGGQTLIALSTIAPRDHFTPREVARISIACGFQPYNEGDRRKLVEFSLQHAVGCGLAERKGEGYRFICGLPAFVAPVADHAVNRVA